MSRRLIIPRAMRRGNVARRTKRQPSRRGPPPGSEILVAGGLECVGGEESRIHCAHVDVPAFAFGRMPSGHIHHGSRPALDVGVDQTELEDSIEWINCD